MHDDIYNYATVKYSELLIKCLLHYVYYMKKVTIEPGCITCGTCEFIAPQVFEVTDICRVQSSTDLTPHKNAIICAARACPVQVIKVEDQEKNE
jgi:ferredoxin